MTRTKQVVAEVAERLGEIRGGGAEAWRARREILEPAADYLGILPAKLYDMVATDSIRRRSAGR